MQVPILLSPPTKTVFFSASISSFSTYETCRAYFRFPPVIHLQNMFCTCFFGFSTYETYVTHIFSVSWQPPRSTYRNIEMFLGFSTPTKRQRRYSVLPTYQNTKRLRGREKLHYAKVLKSPKML